MKKKSRLTKGCLSLVLTAVLTFGGVVAPDATVYAERNEAVTVAEPAVSYGDSGLVLVQPADNTRKAAAAEDTAETETANVITSMAYTEGPNFTASTIAVASFGFRMPTFNGGSASWGDVSKDLGVNVKVDGVWMDIDSVDSLVYNSNWGHWSDGGAQGYWFKLSESTYIQLYSKSNPSVTLDYNMVVNTTDVSNVTGLAPAAGTTISGNRSGTGFIAFPKAVAPTGTYETKADNYNVYVKKDGEPDSAYVNIDNNAESGWIYDTNFGIEDYGYWFKVEESGTIQVKFALKKKESVSQVYTITYADTVRSDYTVHANGATTIKADEKTGAAGVVFPWLGGTGDDNLPTNKELDNFVIEFYQAWDNQWVDFTDSTRSHWHYQGSGYVDYSSDNQWGYFDDYVFGLWFQPITEDFKLRIGYPKDGTKGGEVGDNYIEYQFIGAPNAYRPPDVEIDDIIVGGEGSDPNALEGWDLYFNDEFNSNSLDMSSWSYNTGYFLDPSDPGTKGWGNNEAEYYTDSQNNTFLADGALHLVAKKDPYTFTCTDANQTKVTADYSSGKIVSKDKVSFTYGRIDFRAKLPSGKGVWPALWMLPNDDTYGTWAASGEIDVMEARGRINNSVCGTLHFGGQWPNNRNLGKDYIFPEGTSYDDGYHVYSCIWEEDNMTFYVDGNFYSYIPKERWYSNASDSDTAPFDQDFYIIMNLAIGGNFDGGILPDAGFTSAEMLVDYVRVYKAEGSGEVEEVAITGLDLNKTAISLQVGQTAELLKVYTPSNTTQKNVTWKSSNESVATVSSGQVKAVGEGTAVITATATANSNISASCTVKVTAKTTVDPDPVDPDPVDPDPIDPDEPKPSVERIKIRDGNVIVYIEDGTGVVIAYYRVYNTYEEASKAVLGDLPGYGMSENNGSLEYNCGAAQNGKYIAYAFNQAGWDVPRVVAVNDIPVEGMETKLVITEQPKDVTAEAGEKITFHVSAEGNGLTYAWQYSRDGGKTWANIKTSNYPSASSADFEMTVKTQDGYQYRCVVTDADGNTATSSAATLTVGASGVKITGQPSDVAAKSGEKITFHVTAEGNGLTYAWQYSRDGGKTWADIKVSNYPSASSADFEMTVKTQDGYQYRCVVTDADGNTATSSAATLTVGASGVKITGQPSDVSAKSGEKIMFHVTAEGSGLTYAWQYSRDGGKTWAGIKVSNYPSASSADFEMTVKAQDGYQYRCVVTDADGNTATSSAATLTVRVSEVKITGQPSDVVAKSGEEIAFHVTAEGNGLTYAWQYSRDGGKTWANIKTSSYPSASSADFEMTVKAQDGYQYRCVVTDADGNTAASSAATLAVRASGVKITGQPSDVSAKSGEEIAFHVVAEGSGLTYAWQYSTDRGLTWANIKTSNYPSAHSADFEMTVKAQNGYRYRCVLTDPSGNCVVSSEAVLTIK